MWVPWLVVYLFPRIQMDVKDKINFDYHLIISVAAFDLILQKPKNLVGQTSN